MNPMILLGVGGVVLMVLMMGAKGGNSAASNPSMPPLSQNAEQSYWANMLHNLNPLGVMQNLNGPNNTNTSTINPDSHCMPWDNCGASPAMTSDPTPGSYDTQGHFLQGSPSTLNVGAATGGRFLG